MPASLASLVRQRPSAHTPPQTLPQAPQFVGSFVVSTHWPSHVVAPAGHMHAPFVQTCPFGHPARRVAGHRFASRVDAAVSRGVAGGIPRGVVPGVARGRTGIVGRDGRHVTDVEQLAARRRP
jgi:hypothetical protein